MHCKIKAPKHLRSKACINSEPPQFFERARQYPKPPDLKVNAGSYFANGGSDSQRGPISKYPWQVRIVGLKNQTLRGTSGIPRGITCVYIYIHVEIIYKNAYVSNTYIHVCIYLICNNIHIFYIYDICIIFYIHVYYYKYYNIYVIL